MLLLGFFLMPFLACTQTPEPTPRSMDEWFDQMQRDMMRGMRSPHSMPFDTSFHFDGKEGYTYLSPDSSSYFYFKIDTSFGGGNMSQHFFRFSPFGETPGFGGSSSFDDIMKQMEEMQRRMGMGFEWSDPRMRPMPEPEEPADGMLPEERLRLEEEKQKQGSTDAPAAPAKPKIKTIRI